MADQGHRVWLDGAVVCATEAHLVAVAAVSEDVDCRGQAIAGAATAKIMAVEEAAAVEILAAAAEVVAASAKARLWRWRPIAYRYK